MGKLEDLIKKAKNYDDVAMLEIVDMFQPVVRKYSRMMNHDEDIASELVLALIELVHNIRLDKLDAPNDYVLISYIGRSLYHKYIYVSQKRCAVVNCEASYEDDAELERASYDPTIPKFSNDIEMMDFFEKRIDKQRMVLRPVNRTTRTYSDGGVREIGNYKAGSKSMQESGAEKA